MKFVEHPPRPSLRGVVRMIWTLSGEGAADAQPVPPDGCVELVLNFGDPAWRVENGVVTGRQPRALVVGELFRPVCVSLGARVDLVGVRLLPGRGTELLDVGGLGGLVDQTAALGDAARPALRSALATLFGMPPGVARLVAVEDALERSLNAAPASAVAVALGVLEASGGDVRIAALAGRLGVSERQLERRFLASAGATPKRFAQVFRFQNALRLIGDGASTFAEVALASGYFDQAHLVRDFRRYTSLSPRAYLGAAHPLADHLTG